METEINYGTCLSQFRGERTRLQEARSIEDRLQRQSGLDETRGGHSSGRGRGIFLRWLEVLLGNQVDMDKRMHQGVKGRQSGGAS